MAMSQIIMFEQDQVILKQIRLKNTDFFEAFYKKYYKRMFMLSYQYIRNHGLVEELVHDVFLKFWNEAATLNIQHSLPSYLSRCIINASLNLLKKEKGEMNRLAKYTESFEETDIIVEDAEILERQLLLLEKALETLPPQCKKVMMMSKFNKCKQQEIADSLNISIKTVKNHLTYGYNKIRVILSEENLLLSLLLLCGLF